MTGNLLGIAVTVLSFSAPAVAWWFLVLKQPEEESPLESFVTIAALSTLGVPAAVLLVNRVLSIPLSVESMVSAAVGLVVIAIVWRTVLKERLHPVLRRAARLVRLID